MTSGITSGNKAINGQATGKKHVLMITYVFPPAAWVGAHRTLKYCRYLGDHGWTPVVLTARTTGVTFTDDNLLRQLPPHIDVHRTLDMDPAKWEDKLTERKFRRMKRNGLAPSAPGEASEKNVPSATAGAGFAKRIREGLKALLKNSPDSHLFWVPFAFARGVRILIERDIDVIYCSTPPHSSHIAAFLLAKCFRKPYVLDFRDPWYVSGSVRQPSGKFAGLLRLETRIKRAIVRQAAHVICVSRGERDEMRREFPDLEAERFSFITNGYDPADTLPEAAKGPASDKLIMIHAGTIYGGVGGELFTAIERLHSQDSTLAEKLEVRLLGEIAIEYQEIVGRLETLGVLKTYGMVPHAQTLGMMRESDVLLILMGGDRFMPSHIPSKTFEYLQAEKPILAIATKGELAEIVMASGLGIVVAPGSVDDIDVRLRELLAARASGVINRSPDRAFIRSFERPVLTGQLAGVLDTVIEPGSGKVGLA